MARCLLVPTLLVEALVDCSIFPDGLAIGALLCSQDPTIRVYHGPLHVPAGPPELSPWRRFHTREEQAEDEDEVKSLI